MYYLLSSDFLMYTGTVVMVEIPSGNVFLARNRTAMPLYVSLEKCHKYFMCGPPLECLNVKHHMHTVCVHLAIPYGYYFVQASQAQASQWHLGDVVYSNASQIWEVIAEAQVNRSL